MRVEGSVCVAVMGTGSAGMRHLWVLQKIPEVRPIAVPRRGERCRELEEVGFVVGRNIKHAAEMGAKFCIVASDTGRHMEDALVALECGLDVLVEKPLAPDAQQARVLSHRVKETNRKLFVGCVMRFSESLNQFRNLLSRVGRLHSVRIECQSYLPDWRPQRPYRDSYSARAEDGGVLRDLIHEVDYAGWLFGWPVAVQATIRNLGRLGIAADEITDLMWEGREGVVVSLTLDYLSRPPRRSMKAMGEWGTLEWDGIEGTVKLALAGGSSEVLRSSQTRDETFLDQANAFINVAKGPRDSRLATGDEGVKALAVCDAARMASASRREETVEYQ